MAVVKRNKQKFILPALVLGILVIFALATWLEQIFSGDHVPILRIEDTSVQAELVTSDGVHSQMESPRNIILKNGDSAVYQVRIPSDFPFSDPVFCFSDYNAAIEVRFGDDLLYSSEKNYAGKTKFFGNLLVNVRLPETARGKFLTVTTRHAQVIPSNHDVTFSLMPAFQVWKYPMLGHEAGLLIYFAILSAAMVLLVFLLIMSILRPSLLRACLLLVFTALVCTWYLGRNQFFYVLTSGTVFNARVEYYALFYAPIPLLAYMISLNRKDIFYRIYLVLLIIFTGLALVSTAITVLPGPYSFNETLQIMQGFLVAFALCMLAQLILTLAGKTKVTRDNRIFLLGFTISNLMAALQVLSFWIQDSRGNLPAWLRSFLGLDFASVGILVFVTTLVYSYVTRTVGELVRQAQEEELKKLAYVDLLSGIHNRSWCVQQMEEMKKRSQNDFTVVFMDADGLKHANDVYGHETGDLLIRTVAEGIRECFGESKGFYGRWGGDEFVAFFYDHGEAEVFSQKFEAFQKRVNEKKTFPFPFSVSVGLCESREVEASDEEGKDNPTRVINEADRRMYEHKKAAKKARQEFTME